MIRFVFPLLLCSFIAQAQSVLRVNNNAGVNAPYTTITAAIAAANTNDIIMVESSITAYDNISINKKVTIVGPGYFLTENLNLQNNTAPASIASITLAAGSDGSSLFGLNITGGIGIGDNITSNDIIISNCRIGGLTLSGDMKNLIISGCYISGNLVFSNLSFITNTIVSNCYINGFGQGSGTTVVTLSHNVIPGSISQGFNCDFTNNIFTGTSFSNLSGSSFKYNVLTVAQTSLSTASVVDNTNVFSVTGSTLFNGISGYTTDTQWTLKAGSPAIGAGLGGVDCGMYGGSNPYRPSGIQLGQPTITNFTAPVTIPQSGTLNVKVSAKIH